MDRRAREPGRAAGRPSWGMRPFRRPMTRDRRPSYGFASPEGVAGSPSAAISRK
jgi:hypothetical protein